ncbi:O-methyltransferase family protein [Viridothelium virens]|uniref:O-methyltransferase family protein n=1 Tax=Viridothelium virens TaxID=1048519 RepID=A0A6A6HGE6_VIRVR|nr:O-methyltransferase family protein [Viridothelium virens]
MSPTLDIFIQEVQRLADADKHGVAGAHEELIEAISRLHYAASTPWEVLWEERFQMLNPLCTRIALEIGALDVLVRKGGNPVTSAELAKETKYDQQAIERIMRVVTRIHIASEVGDSIYRANESTGLLVNREGIAGEKYFFDFLFPIGANIVPCLKENGLQQFHNPNAKTPFEYTFGAPIFDYLSNPKHLESKQIFDSLMHGRRKGAPIQWFDTYPAARELRVSAKNATDGVATNGTSNGTSNGDSNEVLLVDIAGNKGHDLLAFSQTIAHTPGQLVLEDLPLTFSQIHPEQNEALKEAGIRLQEYDFFTPQPVKGARAYFFRDICHDWSDAYTERFLARTAEAMTPGYSKLLIEDHVVDDIGAHHRPAASDVLMMLVLSGIERTRKQWYAMLEKIGLEIVHIWPSKRGHQSVIEAIKRA